MGYIVPRNADIYKLVKCSECGHVWCGTYCAACPKQNCKGVAK